MRWEELFADLEAQADADGAAAWREEVAARERSERASVPWSARVAAAQGSRVRLALADGAILEAQVRDGGDEWILVRDADGREHVVASAGVDAIEGLPARGAHRGVVERRVRLTSVLRSLARDRTRVAVVTRTGSRVGLIAWVGADHLEIGEPGRAAATVPTSAIVVVRPA
ncbi:hypothetical protein [Demequina sp. NBRC 110055]|uniref:hypothetical protein n=1 Tax=Demequina sp. NBRC 110055 TaxID=1570344 RepID=UPI000A00F7E9|nr:hypothetical protein [Demequina sp. NBRC 110055]